MDAEILHQRLAASESALIKIDERLDALDSSNASAEALARIISLEEKIEQCLETIEALKTTSQEQQTLPAEARAAEAIADAAEAEARAAEALALASLTETETATEPETSAVLEVEPESDGDGGDPASQSAPSPRWWESLFALR